MELKKQKATETSDGQGKIKWRTDGMRETLLTWPVIRYSTNKFIVRHGILVVCRDDAPLRSTIDEDTSLC
jgi:hypothetical protein